jgi:Arc/MetJ-type ribon-helix-helix transcriptional regulator
VRTERESAIGVRLPRALRARLQALVGPRKFPTRHAAIVAALERGLADPPAATAAAPPRPPRKKERLERFHFRINEDQARRLRAHAVAAGHTSVPDAIAALVSRALDEELGRAAVPAQKADELGDVVRSLTAAVGEMGAGTLGLIHLLAHWAARTGGLKASEDEILAEVWAVGADKWSQVLEELAAEPAAGTLPS